MYSLCVKKLRAPVSFQERYTSRDIVYLPDNLRWFRIVDSFKILLHSCIVVPLLVKIVTIPSKDNVSLHGIKVGLLRKIDCQYKKISLIKYIKLLLYRFLMITKELSRQCMWVVRERIKTDLAI